MPTLAEAVRQRAAGSPLDQVEAALAIGEELTAGADELIGLFVDEARSAGCSWTEIGERIGVSKQAARQRFAQPPRPGFAGGLEWRPRLLACLQVAGREASADGAAEIGTHHQLLGLFHEGVAAAVLEKLGIRADAARAAARELFPGGGPAGRPATAGLVRGPPGDPGSRRPGPACRSWLRRHRAPALRACSGSRIPGTAGARPARRQHPRHQEGARRLHRHRRAAPPQAGQDGRVRLFLLRQAAQQRTAARRRAGSMDLRGVHRAVQRDPCRGRTPAWAAALTGSGSPRGVTAEPARRRCFAR